jgi:hypothetical protein
MTIVWGILVSIIGVLTVVFSEKIYNFTGSLSFVESKVPGGSRSFIKLIGILMIIGGLLVFSGAAGFITDPLGKSLQGIFGGLKN